MTTTTSVIGGSSTTNVPIQLESFTTTTVMISGDTWTVAVADTPALRAQGLMGVTDLGDLDGMLFVYQSEVSNGFWMKDTLIPLDIVFFDANGVLVDLLTMTPCESDPCPVYTPAGQYRYAIETEVGRWAAIDQPGLIVG